MADRDKRQKFRELAEKRVTKAIKSIRLVGNLSNTNNYAYSAADVDKICRALESELRQMRLRFERRPAAKTPIFELD